MRDDRAHLIDAALERATRAHAAYKDARNFRQEMEDELPYLPQSDGSLALLRARIAENATLTAWRLALDAHYQLIMQKRPS